MEYVEISAVKCLSFCENFLKYNKISLFTTEAKKQQIKKVDNLIALCKIRKRSTVRLTSDEIEFLKIS